jgi:hypothetical protein
MSLSTGGRSVGREARKEQSRCSSKAVAPKDHRALTLLPSDRRSLAPELLWLKGPEAQRFIARMFVELRSSICLSWYDPRLLFSGFAYCLIMGLRPEDRKPRS